MVKNKGLDNGRFKKLMVYGLHKFSNFKKLVDLEFYQFFNENILESKEHNNDTI